MLIKSSICVIDGGQTLQRSNMYVKCDQNKHLSVLMGILYTVLNTSLVKTRAFIELWQH